MRLVLALAVLTVACSYDDPELQGHFKCDATHPCPSPQSCVAGVCTDADAGSGSDSGSGSNGSADGVKCGGISCDPGMQCCAGPLASSVCQPAGAACTSGSIATCDGAEDCSSDQACCGTFSAACGAPSCAQRACQGSDDCAGIGTGTCCFDVLYLPWGFCC